MNKNVELATALSYVKEQLKISVVDAVATSTKQVGVETTADNWKKIRYALEIAVDNTVNNAHNAFRALVK
jgi:hypothetical protein|tara:strand:+ start:976 stop:1185 length:210 start_codon:yes stop_codon:yes gene_type:complete